MSDALYRDEVREIEVHHVSSSRPIAKKAYVCADCGQPIVKGEKHYKNIYKLGNDDTIRWYRSHIVCPGW